MLLAYLLNAFLFIYGYYTDIMRLLYSATCSNVLVCSEPETVDRVLIYSVEQINDKNQLPFSVPIKQEGTHAVPVTIYEWPI